MCAPICALREPNIYASFLADSTVKLHQTISCGKEAQVNIVNVPAGECAVFKLLTWHNLRTSFKQELLALHSILCACISAQDRWSALASKNFEHKPMQMLGKTAATSERA